MFKKIVLLFTALVFSLVSMSSFADTKVRLETSKGNIVIELDSEHAPISSNNFIEYVNSGFYNGLIFHRVIPNFMIQGGGFNDKMDFLKTNAPIKNEANNGLKNDRGTIAMARTNAINSATSQFFINVVDNNFLNYQSDANYGYAVFGKVIEGMDVVDAIVAVKTGRSGPHQNVPLEVIYIKKAEVIKE